MQHLRSLPGDRVDDERAGPRRFRRVRDVHVTGLARRADLFPRDVHGGAEARATRHR
jgi:hypothetical protein